MRSIVIAVLAVAVAVGGLEAALRARLDPGAWSVRFDTGSALDAGRWVRHPFLPFRGKPFYRYATANEKGSQGRNNSYGFRSREFPAIKGPDDYFVVCVGETGLDGEESIPTWPELLERRLGQRYPARHVTVFDLGSELATTATSVVDLSLVGIHLLPDLVVVYHGCSEMVAIGAEDFRVDHSHLFMNLKPVKMWDGWIAKAPAWLRSSYIVAYAAGGRKVTRPNDLRDLVTKGKRQSQDPFNGFDVTLRNLRTLHAVSAGRGGETLFSTYAFNDGNDPLRREFNDRLRTFFDDNGFGYVDQARLVRSDGAVVTSKECELTSTGHATIADNFAERIVQDEILDLSRGMARPSTTVSTEFRTSSPERD